MAEAGALEEGGAGGWQCHDRLWVCVTWCAQVPLHPNACESEQLRPRVCSYLLCECPQLAVCLWVMGMCSGVCIPVTYVLWCFPLWCPCVWLGATVLALIQFGVQGPSRPWSVLGCLWVCGHGKHFRGAWVGYMRGPGQAVCCAGGGASSVACPHTHTHTLTCPLLSEGSLLGSLSTGCFFHTRMRWRRGE